VDFVERYERYLPQAQLVQPVAARHSGTLVAVDGRLFGNAIIELGGGRRSLGDELDLAVGFSEVLPIGSVVEQGQALAVMHAASPEAAARAEGMLRRACTISNEAVAQRPLVYETLTAD